MTQSELNIRLESLKERAIQLSNETSTIAQIDNLVNSFSGVCRDFCTFHQLDFTTEFYESVKIARIETASRNPKDAVTTVISNLGAMLNYNESC